MKNLRHFTRVKIDLGAEIMYNHKAFEVNIKDISLGGAYLETDLPLRLKERVELRIFLSSSDHVVETEGQVAWLKGDQRGLGVEFTQLKPIDVWTLLQQTEIDPSEAFSLPTDKNES